MSKLESPPQDNIPTLTEVVKSTANGEKKSAARPVLDNTQPAKLATEPVIEASAINRNELEKLIYKKLHQQLPIICQQLADEIIAELDSVAKPESGKTSKSRSRR